MTIWNNIFFIGLFLIIAFIATVNSYATIVLQRNWSAVSETLVGRTTYGAIQGCAVFHLIFSLLLVVGITSQRLNIDLDFSNWFAFVLAGSLLWSYLQMVIGLTRHAWLWAGRLTE